MSYMRDVDGRRLDSISVPSTDELADGQLDSRRFDAHPLRTFQAALAARETRRVNIGLMGASVAEGAGTAFDSHIDQELAELLRQSFGLPAGGRGFIGTPEPSAVLASGLWPQTAHSGATIVSNTGSKHAIWFLGSTQYIIHTFAPGVTSFDIVFITDPTGSATGGAYNVDYGAGYTGAVTFSTLGAPGIGVVTVDTSGNDPVSVAIAYNGGVLPLLVDGVHEYVDDEASGIQVHNLGHSGMSTAEWRAETVANGATGWPQLIERHDLDLLIMQDFGINDALPSESKSPAQVKTALLDLIAFLRTNDIDCPILLTATYDVWASGNPFPDGTTWEQYVTVMREIAVADPTIAFLDHSSRMPPTVPSAATHGLYAGDNVHGTARSNRVMAETLAHALVGAGPQAPEGATGAAGGVLSGTYPNPTFAADMATQVELNDHVNDTTDAHDASAISYNGSAGLSASQVEAALDELDTEKAPLASPAFTGTPTAPTQSAGDNSTKLATTAYVDALIAAADAMVFKGVIDASANPNYPAANKGDTYRISVAGKVGGGSGATVEVGDLLVCLADGSSAGTQAAVGANWSIAQTNIDGAVVGPSSAVDNRLALFDGATGKLIKDSGVLLSAIALLASPTFTGTPAAPTASPGTNTTQLATTAFVAAALAAFAPAPLTPNTQSGTTYTPVIGDAEKRILFTSSSAVTVTIPTNASVAFPIGTRIEIQQSGTGQITVNPAGGVTRRFASSATTRAQWSVLVLMKIATDEWVLSGDAT